MKKTQGETSEHEVGGFFFLEMKNYYGGENRNNNSNYTKLIKV